MEKKSVEIINRGLFLINSATRYDEKYRYFTCSVYCGEVRRYVSNVEIDIERMFKVLKSKNTSNVGIDKSHHVEDRTKNVIMHSLSEHFDLYFHLDSNEYIVATVREASLITVLYEITAITEEEKESLRKI